MGVKNAFLSRLLASSDTFSNEQVTQTINLLVEHAVKHAASDIHIEPHEHYAQVRYRIDNVLRGMHKLPLAALPAIVTQLKELCHLKANLDHIPQEGQYAALVGEDQFEIQIHTMPVIGGEKIVMHVSRRLDQAPTLQALGFWGNSLKALQQIIASPHGLLVVAVPRRNGKTTTLHSILRTINNPSISIATVEDALEYRLPGVSQTLAQPKHGVTFYTGLQAVLNQDPNVVMLSNIPDTQTAQATVQAAASGHLLIAGLHAETAASALSQLQIMSTETLLFTHAIRAALSQRLVRRLCASCRQLYLPSPEEIAGVEKAFGVTSANAKQQLHQLEKQALQAGMGDHRPSTSTQGISQLWRADENGCEACNHTGYTGSIAIVEVLSAQEAEIQSALLAQATADKIARIARKTSFIPIEIDGLVKVLRGQTSIAELLRALPL